MDNKRINANIKYYIRNNLHNFDGVDMYGVTKN